MVASATEARGHGPRTAISKSWLVWPVRTTAPETWLVEMPGSQALRVDADLLGHLADHLSLRAISRTAAGFVWTLGTWAPPVAESGWPR